jgi:hypothetical protein
MLRKNITNKDTTNKIKDRKPKQRCLFELVVSKSNFLEPLNVRESKKYTEKWTKLVQPGILMG